VRPPGERGHGAFLSEVREGGATPDDARDIRVKGVAVDLLLDATMHSSAGCLLLNLT
jgi:hypothetical protein